MGSVIFNVWKSVDAMGSVIFKVGILVDIIGLVELIIGIVVFIIIELFLGKIGIVELMIGIWVIIIGFIGIVVLIIRFIVEIEIWVDKRFLLFGSGIVGIFERIFDEIGIVVSDDLGIGIIIHFIISSKSLP